MIFGLLHEIGHMISGIILGFKPDFIQIMPFGFSISFKSKCEDYNSKIGKGTLIYLKKIIIAFSGPLVNYIFILFFCFMKQTYINELIILSNITIGLFNLIPIYPLDGGRILKNIFSIIYGREKSYKYTNIVSNVTISVLTAISSIAILYFKNIAILLILVYLWVLVYKENRFYKLKKQVYRRYFNINIT